MKPTQWAGLVTNASPYAIPPGAAVEQVNLHAAVPGQLTCRDGMRPVVGKGNAGDFVDCYPYEVGGRVMLIVLRSDGCIVSIESPAYGSETLPPSEPPLTLTSLQTGTTYTQRFVVGQASEPQPPAPPAPQRINELFGGSASTASWPYIVNGGGASSSLSSGYVGGSASTAEFPPSVPVSNLAAP